MKKALKRLVVVVAVLVSLFSVMTPRALAANGEYTKPECEGVFQDLTCTSLDHIAAFMTAAYDIFVDRWLDIEPSTFDYEYVGSPGHALHEAWNALRTLANAAFAILLIFVVLSQVTGIGISNYGIKKMMPRLVTGVLMVNLSYFICQGAIDLSNLVGSGLGSLFEDLIIDSIPPEIGFSISGGTALKTMIVAVISALVIKAKGLGYRIILLAALGVVVVAVAVCMIFVIVVVRQALCILLVTFSPIAFVCYMLPGTKSIFDKWFSLFKGVLFAYPICSLMIYGGSYAGSVIYGTWIDNGDYSNTLRDLSYLIITTVPYFFIPAVIMKSLAEAEGAVAKLGNFLKKNGRDAAMRTRGMTDLQRRADQGQQLARAGYKRNIHGDIVKKRRPKKLAENSSDGALRRNGKRVFNSILRYQDQLDAPYLRNVTRIKAEERRANSFRRQYQNLRNENFYVFDSSENKYVKVSSPLTNRQIRRGRTSDGRKIFRATVAKPNTSAGSSDFVESSAGDVKRMKQSIRARRLADVTGQEQNLETAAWRAQIKNDNLSTQQISDAMKQITTDDEHQLNSTQLSAYASALIADGVAGRDALEALLADSDVQRNVDAIRTIATGFTQTELNSIKKKNPILYNKIMAILNDTNGTLNVGDLSRDSNFAVTEGQLDGFSPKHLSEMDASAQKRLVDDLLDAVSADAKDLNNPRAVKAVGLAEGALGNAEIRAMMSSEQVANLEQIVNMRKTAVEAISAKTIRSDRSALDATAAASGTNYSTILPEQVGDYFRKDFANTFLTESVKPGGNDGILDAMQNGFDTTRMESIVKAANAQLDEILRSKGLRGANLVAARDDIMRGVMEDVDKAVNEKSKKMVDQLEANEQAAGTSTDDIKKKTSALKAQLGGPSSICDVLTQRINMRG